MLYGKKLNKEGMDLYRIYGPSIALDSDTLAFIKMVNFYADNKKEIHLFKDGWIVEDKCYHDVKRKSRIFIAK